ncbi:MAG: HD domain-containing phosphohydrolase [Polyangiaceae bacterium]
MTQASNRRILCVDDEQLVLEGLERTLFEHFDVTTESRPARALEILQAGPAFAVVLSDMRMPEMDGATLLARARELVPETSRMLLTGQADINSAVAAVNQGQILRFLWKPCPAEALIQALELGVEQHRLVTAERELLERTVTGCVRLMSEVLSFVAPALFSRTQRIKALVTHMVKKFELEDPWRFEVAALFSMIGCVGLPEGTLEQVLARRPLDAADQKAFDDHPLMAHRLLSAIPRFEEIGAMIKLQTGGPHGVPKDDIERGGAMLRVALQVERLTAQGKPVADVVAALERKLEAGEQPFLKALADFRNAEGSTIVRALSVAQMTAEMILEEDVRTTNGVVVVPKGRELSMVLIERLSKFARAGTLVEPIRVRVAS